MGELTEQSLSGFVEAVGADQPAPGAGAAGAVALALAAACLAKAFAISARHADDSEDLNRLADEARMLSRLALEGAERDAEGFKALLQAKGEAEGVKRDLQQDNEAMLTVADRIRLLVATHGQKVTEAMRGDMVAAAALVAAADRIERNNLAEL